MNGINWLRRQFGENEDGLLIDWYPPERRLEVHNVWRPALALERLCQPELALLADTCLVLGGFEGDAARLQDYADAFQIEIRCSNH